MDFVGESFDSTDGDDDKVYLFFSENAMEYDYYSKVAVSRVARVCKVKLKTESQSLSVSARLLALSETLKNRMFLVRESRFNQAHCVTLLCLFWLSETSAKLHMTVCV